MYIVRNATAMHGGGTKFYSVVLIYDEDNPSTAISVARWGKAVGINQPEMGQREVFFGEEAPGHFDWKLKRKAKSGYDLLARCTEERVDLATVKAMAVSLSQLPTAGQYFEDGQIAGGVGEPVPAASVTREEPVQKPIPASYGGW